MLIVSTSRPTRQGPQPILVPCPLRARWRGEPRLLNGTHNQPYTRPALGSAKSLQSQRRQLAPAEAARVDMLSEFDGLGPTPCAARSAERSTPSPKPNASPEETRVHYVGRAVTPRPAPALRTTTTPRTTRPRPELRDLAERFGALP